MSKIAISFVLSLITLSSHAGLAHHWKTKITNLPVTVQVGGLLSLFALDGSFQCVVTDPDTLGSFTISTGTGNTISSGQTVCRMAMRFNLSAGCSVNVTTNTYVCTGEVNPTNCTITQGKQVTCT